MVHDTALVVYISPQIASNYTIWCIEPVSGVHQGYTGFASSVVPRVFPEVAFSRFAGRFATGHDAMRPRILSDKEEVPGSSPGSPTRIGRFCLAMTASDGQE